MASWSVVREDLLRRWLDARNRAGRGTYAAGGSGARTRSRRLLRVRCWGRGLLLV